MSLQQKRKGTTRQRGNEFYFALIISFCVFCAFCGSLQFAFAQTPTSALQQLRDQLVATNGLRDADVVAVFSEKALNDFAQRLIGLEVKHPKGINLKINAVAIELKPAVALVTITVQAEPSVKIKSVNLRLSGKMGTGEMRGNSLRVPFELTDVDFGNEDSKLNGMMKLLLGDWLKPEHWNSTLPPLEIPLQLKQDLEIPAATFEANGELSMTVNTPAYKANVEFWPSSFLILDGRAVVALSFQPTTNGKATSVDNNTDEIALAEQIAQLSQHLITSHGVRLRVRKAALNFLFAKIAAAQAVDLTVQLKSGRVRAEEIDALIGKIINYTDVESGTGQADIAQLVVEDISPLRVLVRLVGQGEVDTKMKGREFGIPYSLSPHGTFVVNDELVPLQITSNNNGISIKAATGAVVPVKARFTLAVAGHPIGFTRTINLQADQWLKNFELPAIFSQDVQLPRKIVIGKDNKITIEKSEMSHYIITNLRLETKEDALEILADLSAQN